MADSTEPISETATDSGAIHADRPPVRAYPANVTFANLIAENRRKSATLVVGMIILLMMVGAAIAALITASGRSDVLLPSLVSGAVVAGIVGALPRQSQRVVTLGRIRQQCRIATYEARSICLPSSTNPPDTKDAHCTKNSTALSAPEARLLQQADQPDHGAPVSDGRAGRHA